MSSQVANRNDMISLLNSGRLDRDISQCSAVFSLSTSAYSVQVPQTRNSRETRMFSHAEQEDQRRKQRRTERDGMELLQSSPPDLIELGGIVLFNVKGRVRSISFPRFGARKCADIMNDYCRKNEEGLQGCTIIR